MEIDQQEGRAEDSLELFVVNPTKVVARLKESMFYIDYRLRKLEDWSMDLEIEAKGLCSMKCKKNYDNMNQWDEILKENK